MVSRIVSLVLRIAQLVFAAIVLGLSAYFLYQRTRHSIGPFGRLVFSVIWASLSVIFAIIWAIPTSSSMTGYVSDLSESHSIELCRMRLLILMCSFHCWLGCCFRSSRPLV